MEQLKEYLQELVDNGIIHPDVYKTIIHLAKQIKNT